jgi:hypothetical protein
MAKNCPVRGQTLPISGLLIIDNGHWSWPLFDNQPINAALVETVDPLAQRTIGDQQCIAN